MKDLNKHKQISYPQNCYVKKKSVSELSRQVLNCHAILYWLQERVKIRILLMIIPSFKRSRYMKFNLLHSYSKCHGAKQVGKRVNLSVKEQSCGLGFFNFVLTLLVFFPPLKKICVKTVEQKSCYP